MEKPRDRSETFRIAVREFGPFETSIRREWDSFQKESGCNLELETVSLDHQPLYAALFEKNGLKGGEWDVAFINTDWLAEAHQSAALVDLAPLIEKNPPEDYPDGWAESLLRLQRFDRQVIGLPYHDGPECLIYRTDVFAEETPQRAYYALHGHRLQPPQTWEEFVRVAEFFNQAHRRLYGTVLAAYPDGHNIVYDVCLQLWTRGGELFDGDGKMQLDTPQMIEALEFYRRILGNRLALHPQCREFDSVAAGEAFLRGEVVMMVNWFGFASVCETEEHSKVKGKVAVAPVPRGKDGPGASLNCYWLLGIAEGSPNRQTAYDFIRHCMSRTADKQRTLDGAIGCRQSTWTDKEVNRAIPFYGRMAALHEDARELPRLANWVDLSSVIEWAALEALDTSRPIKEIVAEAQKKADAIGK